MANLNFSDIPSNDPLPEGIYIFDIEKVEEKVSTNGNEMYLIRFKEPESKKAVFETFVLKADCLWKLKQLTDALGLDFEGEMDSTELAAMLVGNCIKAKVIQEERSDNGEMTNRIKNIYPA